MEDEDLFNDSDEEPSTSTGKKPVAGAVAAAADKPAAEGKGVFRKELAKMMHGFGEDKEPYDKTLEMLESIVLDYIKEMCERAKAVGKPDKIQLEDIHYLIRRDAKKFARVKDLLTMSDELKKARKQFEDASTEKL